MKKILLGVVAGLMVASCSKNETVSLNQDEIQFSVVTNKAAKAADLYCSNNLPDAFNVWASYKKGEEAATYFEGDEIKNVGGTWQNQSGDRYWPSEGTLNFYAHVNAGQFNWTVDAPTIDFKVAAKAEDQKDLLYAVATDKSRQTEAVGLNFRHALSQIVFKAKNTNPKLHVVIDGITVCNVYGAGTFSFSTSTENEFIDHTQVGDGPTDGLGTWAFGNNPQTETFTAVCLKDGNTGIVVDENGGVLTGGYTHDDETFNTTKNLKDQTLLLLPQTNDAWDPKDGVYKQTTGAYFLVNCRIYNIAGDEYVEGKDVELWKGDAAIPVTIDWKQGKKYIYTFAFGSGNGGYEEDNDPVLVPITFTVSVDDFSKVDVSPDIDMETAKENETPSE